MKNTLLKVWGIVLTLAILSGLLMATVPAAAADNSWTTLTKPLVTVTTNANVFTIAADGKTMYMYDNNDVAANSKFYKSTDAGLTWSSTGMDADLTLFGAKPIRQIKVNPSNANSLIATNGTTVYTTADGGKSWNLETPTVAFAAVTSVDIATNASGVNLLVGYGADIALSINNRWYGTNGGYAAAKQLDNAGWLLFVADKTLAAAFSPTFANDSAIVVVTRNFGVDVSVATYIYATGATWNGDVAITPTTGFGDVTGQIPASVTATAASIAFAADYAWASSSLNKVFVAITTGTTSVIYRINGKTASTATARSSFTAMTITGVNVISLAFKGPVSTGTLAAGASNDPAVYTITGVSNTTTFNWVNSSQNPRGGTTPNTKVAFSPISGTLYAGTTSATGTRATAGAVTIVGGAITAIAVATAGVGYAYPPIVTITDPAATAPASFTTTILAGGVTGFVIGTAPGSGGAGYVAPVVTLSEPYFGSAFSASTDYNSFAGISFVSTTALAKVGMPSGGLTGVSGATQWQKLYDSDANVYSLFKSVDSGATWNLVYENGAIGFSVYLSPAFATDNTVYLVQVAPRANKLIKTYDAGATWGSVTVAGNYAISGFAPIDGTNYWFGTADGIRSNTNATFAYLDGNTPFILINLPGAFLVWSANFATFTCQVWVSTDGGVTFTSLDTVTQINNGLNSAFTFGFDGKNWTIYMVDSAKNIKSYTVGVSTAWKLFATLPAAMKTGAVASIGSVPGGAWYFGCPGNATSTVYRSTDLLTFEAVDSPGTIVSIPSLTAAPTATGTVNLYTCVSGTATATLFANKWVTYTDTRLTAPTVVSPVKDSLQTNIIAGSTMVDFMWNAVPNATGYSLEVAFDSAFTNMAAASPYTVTGTSKSQVGLTPGRDYYWRVRVSLGNPLTSYYSTGNKFSTAVVSSTSTGIDEGGRIYPAQGAVITGTAIAFTWGSVSSADTYEFKLMKNGVEVVSKTGITDTVYQATGLEPGAQYTWQVRAVAGGVAGKWVTSAFTTVVPPATTLAATTAAPVVPQPTPQVTVNVPAITVPQATVNVTVPPGTSDSGKTPAWAWIVIAIGAVLVIAVIVLIVRTRKV